MLRSIIAGVVVAGFACTVIASEPATQPADESKRRVHVDMAGPADGVIQLPDGTTINLADLPNHGMTRVAIIRGMGGDGMTIQVTDDRGRDITIHESESGRIEMTIREPGQDPTEITADNAEELEKNHPEEFELFERYARPQMMLQLMDGAGAMGGGAFEGRQMRVLRGGGPAMGMGARPVPIDTLGASGAPVRDPFVRAQLGDGVIISSIDPESFAETLGLKPFDLIKSVNDQPVRTPQELDDALVSADKVHVGVIRGGKPIILEEE